MSNTTRIIQIPVLFDMSGSSLVFGEQATGDFVDSHLQFLLDMTTEANGISLNATDISSSILIGEQDGGDNIFFDGDSKGIGIDNLCNRIAKAITRGKLVHIPSIGNFSNSGIPIGGEGHLYSLHGDKMPAGGYSKKYTTTIAPIGDEQMLGQAMARVASIHLIGDPLGSQAFEDAASIQTSLETASSQTFNQGMTAFYNALAVQLSKVLGGSKSSAPMNPGVLIGSEKYSTDYNLTAIDQTYNNDGRMDGSSLTGQVYTASTSWNTTSYSPKNAFDTNVDSVYRSTNLTFDTTSGLPKGGTLISGVNGLTTNNTSWQGFWLKVDIGQTVVLSEYKIHPRHNTGTVKNTPKEGYLLSSTDNINWVELHHLNLDDTTGRLLYYDSGYGSADTDLTALNNREGRYFAFVFQKVFTGSDQGYGGIGELELLGVTKDEFDGGNPPAAYDVASSASTLSGQSYSSSHHYDNSWEAHEAFDNTHNDASAWLTPSGSFTQATGELISTYQTVTFSSGIQGQWIQVDLSQNVNPGKFYLNSPSTSYPTEGWLLSSKDKTNFDIVHTLDSNNWNTHSTDRIHYEFDISGTPTGEDDIKIGSCWRLIITKMNPSNTGYIQLYDFNLQGIVYPTDFGSAPSTTNQVYVLDKTPYDFTSKQTNGRFMVPAIAEQRYTASTQWDNTSYAAEKAFLDDMQEHWRSTSLYRYHTTTGLHDFSTWTGPYKGEWIQVDLSENFVAASYVIEGNRVNHADNKNSPKKGYLLGSIDNKRWNLIHTFDLSSNVANEYYNATDGYKVVINHTDKTSVCSARYFRFVIEKLFPGCDGYVVMYNLRIYGVKESEATLGNGGSTTTFIDDYSLKVTPYNLSVHMPTTSIEDLNISPSFTQNRYTASSTNSTSTLAWEAFTPNPSTYMWSCAATLYNTAEGTYYGATLTDIYPGEWVQVDLSENVFADSYTIQGYLSTHQAYVNSSPKKGYLLSSLDGKDWRLAHTFDIQTVNGDYTWTTADGYGFINHKITNNKNAIGRYWRFVTEKVFPGNSAYVAITQFSVYGAKHPSETIQGGITKTTQDNSIYTLDVTPYNLTSKSFNEYSHGSSLTGQTYSASSSGNTTTQKAESAFESYHTNNWFSRTSRYNSGATSDGEYYGTVITGDYPGEWLQVDLSENVFADSYTIQGYLSTHQAYVNSSPKKGYLLSSLDGKDWRLAHTFDIQTVNGDYTWTTADGYGFINHKITNNKNAIGRYWRFVTEKVFPGNSAYVAINSFNIYGGKYPSEEVNVGNGAETTTIKNYTLTETAYDFSSVDNAGVSLIQLPVRSENLNNRISSSSYVSAGYEPVKAFAGYSNYDWRCYGTPYVHTSGLYHGVHATGPYKGEWIQVDLSENYITSSYVLQGYPSNHHPHNNSSPKKGYLLSSLDGNTWRLDHTFEETTDNADYTYNTTNLNGMKYNEITCNDYAIGRYWRFVVEKLFAGNSGYVNIRMLTLNGVKESQKIEGVISTDVSNNNPGYVFNVTSYDLTNTHSVLTGHEYSASSVHTATTYAPDKAFENLTTGNPWRSLLQYNSGGSGLYYGTKFTGPYKGEWIQVDLSENVFADSYRIGGWLYAANHAPYHGSSPKKGYLLSSLDGNTWRLAHTFEETSDTADYVYTSTDGMGSRYNDISNNENAIGRYWRFVVEKLFGINEGYAVVSQFTIMGVKYPSEVTVQNVAVDPSLNIVRNLPADMATIYDLVSSASTITGQTYTSSTNASASYEPVKAFNDDTANTWRSIENQYNVGSGTYYGNKSTGEYYGEWIQVDVGQNVVIGQYKIHPWYQTHGTYFNTSVKKGYLLSSLDANKWNLVHTFEVANTNAYNYSGSTSTMTPVTTSLNGTNCKGRYFRLVVNQLFPSNEGEVNISQFEILGVKENESITSAESKVESYNTFTNNTIPYDIYRRTLAHDTTPYLISTEVSSLVPIDIASQNSTISGQSYSATYGTAQNAFDNSGNTEWSTDASSNYGIIAPLITNEPGFTSWTTTTDGIISTFSENITAATVDKSNFSIYDSSMSMVVPIHNVEISNGKLLVTPLTGYQYNTNVAEYDLTSTSSSLYGTRGDITFTSEYNHGDHDWLHAFNGTMDGPAIFASGSWSGINPVGGVDFVINGVTYHGHWVQLDVGQNVLVKTFEYTPRNAYQSAEWDTLLIAGSKDGTTWDLLWRETERTQSTAQVTETYAVNATDTYSQFRWLCEKTTGSASYAFNALEITLLGQKESEASLVSFTASKINDYIITYTKPLIQDNQLKGVTNSVALQSFVLEDGAVTGRGEYAILPLSLNEPSFTSSQVVNGKLEYTFSENLQAGAGGFDITDFQLIEPSGNTVDLSSNDCGIVGGKLVIGTYAIGLYPQGNNYALSGVNATHSGSLYYSATPDHNTTHSTDKFHDGNTSTSWLSINDTYVSGTYAGSVSTATTNAGTINGEYVQIDVGVNSVLSHFTYYTQDSHKNYSPSSGSLVGSKDNVNWDVITSFSYDKDNDPNEVTKNISTQAEYRYYRLIFAAVNGGHVCGVNEWTLFGHVRENYYIGETISNVNYLLIYNKNATVNKNIIGATNNVAINSFHIDNNLLIGRGGVTNIGQYDGSTSTTLTDTSTYKGEYIQIDIGKNVVINNYAINVKSINGNDNPKSWILVGSLNNSDWTKLDEKFNHTLTENYTATVTSTKVRYLRLIVNRGGTAKHIKISEFKVNGIEIQFEGQTYSASLDNGDAYTVFNNSITTNWDTSSSRNYNGVETLATNEPEFSSIGIHTDASGNGRLELTFNANVSSTDINTSNFTVTDLDLSNSDVIIADISDGKIMIEKQAEITGSIFYENFDDQAFYGDVATADIVSGGRDGTGHCIKGEFTYPGPTNKYWKKIITYRAISFWHEFTTDNYNGRIWSCHLDDNNVDSSVIDLHHYSNHYRYISESQAGGGKWTKFYIDGVAATPYAHNTGISNGWHHLYLEFSVDVPQATFLAGSGSLAGQHGSAEKIDEVRFYSQAIPEAQIIEMANGWTGTYPGATFPNTNYRINYVKDASSARLITGPEGVPINNFIIHDGTLISRGTNYGHYRGSTTTTYNTNQTYNGEHINVNTGQPSYITEYELHVPAPDLANSDNNVYPKSWILLGSTNGSDWSKIHEVTDYTGWTTNSSYSEGYKVNYLTEIVNMVAQHYRLIINKTFGKVGHTSVAELLIKGVKHTSETSGLTQVKTASLGTAANAFDSNISTDWNTSSSATYSLIAAPATNEPIFSSGTINGSSQIELTFDTNIDISGTFNKSNLAITNSSFAAQAYNASIDSGKLLLSYNAEQFPGLDTIFIETFDDQTTTDPLGAEGSIVAGGKDGLGYALKRTTTQTAAGGVVFEQTTIPENIKSMSFWAIVDETDTSTSWHNLLWIKGSSGGNWDTYILRFKDNALGQGTSEQKHMVEKYYIDGVLCGGATLSTSYDTDITEGGNPVTENSFKGTWRHIYLEWQLPINDPNVTNSFVSKIFWMSNAAGGYAREGRIDDIRFYGQALTEAQITTLATNNLSGTFSGSLSDYNIQYTKTNNGNLVNASHTSVGVNSFALVGGTITNRGGAGIGDYRGSTSTTLPDSSTYDGEWIQIDVGQTILMTEIKLVVPNKDAYTNPKSWKLLVSPDNTNWVELLDISNNTVWDSGIGSASTQFTGFEIGHGLVNKYVGRYFKVIVNSIIGPDNHVKINEIVIKGVMHTVETDVVNGPYPTLHTATPSSNTTTNHTPVTTTTHNANDTVTTTSVETTVDIAATTVTTTTTKTTVNEVVSAVTLNTATPSSTTTVHSDTTALTTTYNNNDTSVRTIVNRTIDISANTDTTTNLNTIITTSISGFGLVSTSGSSFNPNKIYDVSGVACPALKSIYEQLMNIPGRSQIMESQDFSTSPMPSVETITGGFPFIAGDKLVMYIRPKIQFAQSTFPEQFTSLIGFGGVTFGEPTTDTALASGGAITGQTYTESSKYSDTYAGSKLFDGSTTTFWITASDTYGGDGIATGGTTTIHSSDGGGTYTGHYVQIEFANAVAIEDIKITPRNLGGGGAGEPKDFRILSSSDGSTFRVAYSVTEGTLNDDWSLWSTQTFHLSNLRDASSKGKYWRIAVGKITTGNKVQLAKVELIGNLSSTLIDNDVGQPVTTGGGGESSTALPSAVGLINQDGTTHSRERGDIANIIDNDDATWSYTTTSYTDNNHAPFIIKFSFPAEQVGKILNSVLLSTNTTASHNMTGIKFGILNGTTYTSLNVTSGTNLGTGATLTTGTVTWDNDTNWHIESYPVGQETTVNFNDYTIQSNDHLVVRWSAATYYKHFTPRYFKFVTTPSGGVSSTTYPTSTLTNGYPTTGSILDISGLETNITKLASTFPVLFPGNTTGGNEAEAQKFGWVGSANADSLSLETTDETDPRTMDLHIWKITITL